MLRLVIYIFLGYQYVYYPENPNNNEGIYFAQSRFTAKIIEVHEQKPGPINGKVWLRRFVEPEEFNKYIKWGDVGEELLRFSLEIQLRKE